MSHQAPTRWVLIPLLVLFFGFVQGQNVLKKDGVMTIKFDEKDGITGPMADLFVDDYVDYEIELGSKGLFYSLKTICLYLQASSVKDREKSKAELLPLLSDRLVTSDSGGIMLRDDAYERYISNSRWNSRYIGYPLAVKKVEKAPKQEVPGGTTYRFWFKKRSDDQNSVLLYMEIWLGEDKFNPKVASFDGYSGFRMRGN